MNTVPKLTVYQVAKMAHEMNREYCEYIGDYSLTSWESSPKWQQDSIISGVKEIIKNPNMTPEENHQKWMDYKFREGWKYGPVKDSIKKEHPCMIPYNELPESQRLKDTLFQNIVKTFLPYIYF